MRGVLALVGLLLVLSGCGSEDVAAPEECTADLRSINEGELEVQSPTWSPDGERIGFTLLAGDKGGIYAITVADCTVEQLGPRGEGLHMLGVDWSSGDLIAFDGTEAGAVDGGIYTMRPDGGGVRRLTDGPDLFPEWSPDGERVAFVRGGYEEPTDQDPSPAYADRNVWIVDAAGTGARQVTRGEWHSTAAWSPDGRRLVAATDPDVVEIGIDGSGRRLLLEGEYHDPSWSPDGKLLLLAGIRIAEGGRPPVEQLDTPPAFAPEWSPDGRWIAFTDGVDESDLWVVRPDGTGLRQLTTAR